ncbi:mitochondrial carrier protein [Skeletonema marinoi]|uniref:Mitochondrial carrier protein n=1 Tax=Skeletonema marinoi TaxID=267567 RepID=A0AAD8Y502_9STRA|nr:mitochondrial carrier protein [Skeletonema marinoi]
MSSSASHTILACAGGIAGVIEAVLVQPLELIKVRFQLNHGHNGSIISCASGILLEGSAAGGTTMKVSRLFRGLLPELCGMFPTRSVMYSSNEMAKRLLLGNDSNRKQEKMNEETTSIIALSGAFSGVAEAAVVTPFQVIKIRLQAKEHLGKYSNSLDCIQKLCREEGLLAFSNCLSATIGRNSVFNCVYFTVMFKIKQVSPTPQDSKSRIQAQCPNSKSSMEYTSTIQALMKIGRTEGLTALYKGFQPKALRMGIGGAVAVTAFEAVCEIAHSL